MSDESHNGGVFDAGENNQNLACANTVECVNLHPSNPNNQNTACQSTDRCSNEGINTNLYSNSATTCTSSGPDYYVMPTRSHIYVYQSLVKRQLA
jgi:hypothetical protein